MSGDKRSVATDALETLGSIIDERAGRDAIHLAVEPVVAGESLRPGTHVGISADGKAYKCQNPVGIVDPFLKRPVEPGERFWLVVYPRTITSLRHVWTHPLFPERPAPVDTVRMGSEAWLREFCQNHDCPSYDAIIAIANGESLPEDEYGDGVGGFIDAEYFHVWGMDGHCEIPYEFWVHLEVVIGRPIRERPKYFSCSC